MTNYEYATWVRGFLQLCGNMPLDGKKIQIFKNHLNLVAAVEGRLGEKNQLFYDKMTQDPEDFSSLKEFMRQNYSLAPL